MQEVLDALPPSDADLAVHLFGLKASGQLSWQQREKHTSPRRTPRRACIIQRLNIRRTYRQVGQNPKHTF